jgi:hypothetical protein
LADKKTDAERYPLSIWTAWACGNIPADYAMWRRADWFCQNLPADYDQSIDTWVNLEPNGKTPDELAGLRAARKSGA